MKKVVVTGGLGFIGTAVVKNLLEKGYSVRVIDNQSKPRAEIGEGYEFLKVDLTDSEKTKEAFKGMDLCINLAAKIGGIGYFHKFPATILSENNKIYSSTFEAAVKNSLERMVYVSSSMVFESTTQFPSKEEDVFTIPPPVSSYGFSKLIGEQYCKAFWDQYKLPYSICRPFNAYGMNEYPEEEVGYAHVIPDLVRKLKNGQYPLELLGSGEQVRCFTHVNDLADGIVTVAMSEKAHNEDFNLADPTPVKIIDLAKKIWSLMHVEKSFKINNVKPFTYDIQKRIPDVSKIEKILSWKTKISLDEGLYETIQWLEELK